MKLQAVGPPEGGSLSVVYSCPECGYEMAMLTNPFETQLVQSLGVRIGPDTGAAAPRVAGSGALVGVPAEAGTANGASTSGCPFAEMMSSPEGAVASRAGQAAESIQVRWTAAAEARLANIPAFVRPMARTGIERYARERGILEVDEQILDAARDFFGM
jgi:hypothetical protein